MVQRMSKKKYKGTKKLGYSNQSIKKIDLSEGPFLGKDDLIKPK